jgi:glycosyltransferase involved in cell wall biosynthesis
LTTIYPLLTDEVVAADRSASSLLSELSTVARGSDDKLWLLMTAVCGVMPTREAYVRLQRLVGVARPGTEMLAVLEGCAGPASLNDFIARSFSVVSDALVVDVDFTSRHGHNTGIQRVVRETIRRWEPVHDLHLVAWTEDGDITRSLTASEHSRVVNWTSDRRLEQSDAYQEDRAELVVPWRSTLLLPEVALARTWERMACAAEFSGNRVVLIGYDVIPITSAQDIDPRETDRFVRYLSIVKHATQVIGISETSSREFAGFASALGGQGLPGPAVVTVALPVDLPTVDDDAVLPARDLSIPLVVCVGTQEPRKNQVAVLAASELLWASGKNFELVFIGGAAVSMSHSFDAEIERLTKLGRPVRVLRNVSDGILRRAYLDARFTVFVSMHEGYGLPVGESLSVGTPVVTTEYGSMAEIAAAGGCLTADPRDDDDIATAMARLLDDDVELARLKAEAAARTPRTWDDYAAELWTAVAR